MDNLIMNHFSGIHFVCSGYWENHPYYHTIRFKDYCGIQYSQNGGFVVRMSNTFKRKVSVPAPGHFLILARMWQAANRLISTNMQMKILVKQCGFGDNLYFSKLFKKYYHRPPLRYREEFRR